MKIKDFEENSCQPSEVCNFYEGKSVFITGAGGFLGKVLLEILLTCCPGILRIYILLRPKKGLQVEDRKKEIFKRQIFHKLIEKDPDALNKVFAVAGDVSQDNLGMCENDLNRIIQDVSIVFHCAASISFIKPINFVVNQNVVATDNIINICKKLNKLEALVYSSTLFSHSNRKKDIKEIVYKMPFKAEEVVRLARIGDESGLNDIFSKCDPKFHTYYAFSKCVTENLLVEKASSLPVSIVRPSFIISCLKGSLPGYVEDGSAIVNICTGIGKGIIQVARVYGTNKFEFIPVDIAANTHIVAAFLQATNSLPSPSVYNCTSGKMSEHSWSEFGETIFEMVTKYPLPKSYIKPSLVLCNDPLLYKFYIYIYHTLPGVIIDFFLWIAGKELRLMKFYKLYDRLVEIGEPYMKTQWDFTCDNFVSLSEKLNETDAEIFNLDVSEFCMKEWIEATYKGTPQYRVNNKVYRDTLSACITRYFLTYLMKFVVLGSIAALCYIIFF